VKLITLGLLGSISDLLGLGLAPGAPAPPTPPDSIATDPKLIARPRHRNVQFHPIYAAHKTLAKSIESTEAFGRPFSVWGLAPLVLPDPLPVVALAPPPAPPVALTPPAPPPAPPTAAPPAPDTAAQELRALDRLQARRLLASTERARDAAMLASREANAALSRAQAALAQVEAAEARIRAVEARSNDNRRRMELLQRLAEQLDEE